MMVIDNLKEIWNSQEESKIQFTELDIYKMIHKKSASIVKWIFYISIIEFVIMIVVPFFMKDASSKMEEIHMVNLYNVSNMLSYVIAVVFIYFFYRNYKAICVQNTAKKLMSDILKTRRIVKYYVGFQLFLGGIVSLVLILKSGAEFSQNISQEMLWVIAVVGVLVVLLIMWLFYMLIYGILLNKLNTNYKELLKAEN